MKPRVARAKRIQIGLREHIARRVRKARFVRAYMTVVHAFHRRFSREVLVRCASFLTGPRAPPVIDVAPAEPDRSRARARASERAQTL